LIDVIDSSIQCTAIKAIKQSKAQRLIRASLDYLSSLTENNCNFETSVGLIRQAFQKTCFYFRVSYQYFDEHERTEPGGSYVAARHNLIPAKKAALTTNQCKCTLLLDSLSFKTVVRSILQVYSKWKFRYLLMWVLTLPPPP